MTISKSIIFKACILCLIFLSIPIASYSQINYYRGILWTDDKDRDKTEALIVSYIIPTDNFLDIELGYRRDGHPNKLPFKMDDRDGFCIGLRDNLKLTNISKFNLGADIYYYYDTQHDDKYVRNFAGILYGEFEVMTPYGFSVLIRGERIYSNKYSIDTNALFLGIGFNLDNNSYLNKLDILPTISNNHDNFIALFNGSGFRQKFEVGHYFDDFLKISGCYYRQQGESYGSSLQFGFSKPLLNNRIRLELTAGPFYSDVTHQTYLLVNRAVSIQIINNVWIISEFGRLPAHSGNSNDEDIKSFGCAITF